jgi:hypothetical protein
MLRAVVSLALVGCAAEAPRGPVLDPTAFVEAKKKIAAIQKDATGDRTEKIALRIEAPYMPAAMTARGAVAIRPPEALRLIMLGPGGTTAMDLWSSGERYRFSIPALDRTLEGDAKTPAAERRGLPVDFLRWWMLRPFAGRLLAARRDGTALEVLIEDGDRVTDARFEASGRVTAHRRWWTAADGVIDEEWLEATGTGCAKVSYRQKSTQLSVEATCESRRAGARDDAFVEPRGKAP